MEWAMHSYSTFCNCLRITRTVGFVIAALNTPSHVTHFKYRRRVSAVDLKIFRINCRNERTYDWLTGRCIDRLYKTQTIFAELKNCWLFVGAFAKSRKVNITLGMSVRPSVLMGQLGSQWKVFHESYVYWTVHHCDSWRIRDQLDVTGY